MVGAEASTALFGPPLTTRSWPGTVDDTVASISMLTSLPSLSMRGRTFNWMPVGRYWNENDTSDSAAEGALLLVAIGMSVPTRMVAWRLSSVSTLGRDNTSALPRRTR